MKIVIVDDENEILKRLQVLFESEGYEVFGLDSISELEKILERKKLQPDLIVLDRMLNGTDSATLIPKIKNTFARTNVLVLSAIDTALEKAEALNAGADDYLAKPFSSIELMARVKVLTRRISLYNSEALKIGNLEIKINDREALVSGRPLNLTHKEFSVLHVLATTPGKVYSKESLLELVWKQSAGQESKVVEVAVNKIRKVLGDEETQVSLKNIRNVGYWLES